MAEKKNTYSRLISSASECFANNGFSATSVKEISQKAGISQGAMYTYFKSKDELISLIVNEEQLIAVDMYKEDFKCTCLQRIYDIIHIAIGDYVFPDFHNRLWLEIMAESSRNDFLRSHYISSDIIMRDGIKKIIELGIEKGEFNKNLNLEEASLVVFSLLDGLVCKRAINPSFSLDNDLPGFMDVLHKILAA